MGVGAGLLAFGFCLFALPFAFAFAFADADTRYYILGTIYCRPDTDMGTWLLALAQLPIPWSLVELGTRTRTRTNTIPNGTKANASAAAGLSVS